MKRRTNNYSISDMYCTKCGNKNIPIGRRVGQYREAGHLKSLYCVYCKSEHNMVEIRPFHSEYGYEDFLIEFNNHNFTDDGLRVMSYKELKTKLRKENK